MTTPQRAGTTMYVLAVTVLVALLTMLFADVLREQRNPNQAVVTQIGGDGTASITLQRNRMGHYVMSGSINGHTVEFLVDTGATAVSVPHEVARRAGLRRGAAHTAVTANGTTTAFATRIAEIAVGEIRQRDVAASIVPNMAGPEVLLGMSFLERLDFSQRGDTLILKSRANPVQSARRDGF